MALPRTNYTSKSAENFRYDSAVLFKDVDFESGVPTTGTPIGATNGGVKIKFEKSYRKMEVDGTYLSPVKGLERIESATATITGTFKEFSTELLAAEIHGAVTDSTKLTGYQEITPKVCITEDDYYENLVAVCWNSDCGEGEPMTFYVLDNARVTSAFEVSTEDSNEHSVEATFTAHQSVEQLNNRQLPYRVFNKKAVGAGA
ncbi:hypothetical protein [Enterococcus nangangensis]|uniref:hypothetical protein n=1 Tax=Enterococcus nangangensis TaxID=2559926 RepID=UPI0010F61CF3|nr:hypothetical protein [Enterococcus nangangensis]